MTGWIGFDLDGTLARYDEWVGPLHIGEPIEGMVRLAREYINRGYTVKIFTARVWSPDGEEMPSDVVEAIESWAEEHIGTRLEVTNKKDYGMLLLYDDRAVRIVANTGLPCCDLSV